ncbi:MAG: collagen-binding protein [Bacteroidia bacterium]|nr:MAG: collagen-binding protein [Bacteroidia bacterium]
MNKLKSYIFVLFVFLMMYSGIVYSQNVINIKGSIIDTAKKQSVPNVLILSIRFSDSTIVHHTRTDEKGYFEVNLPKDTFQIVFLHPDFSEKIYFVLGNEQNRELDFGKIILPPKEYQLDEIVIYADKEPVYYKGDTLVYVADSFKVKPDATVEDLLKKLPGIQVDSKGKITFQGREVDKVLVDGDEFFGSDPTVATKNLQAKQVETIQAYEQKNTETTDNQDKETLQILNIQLKEEAKKGYFGTLMAGSDAKKFYESKLLFNRFRDKHKLSIFGMSGNTPNFRLSWSDIDRYGLENEYNYIETDDDMFLITNDEDNGIPQLTKGGVYFNEKFRKIKLNGNYTFNQKYLRVIRSERSQFFLRDSTYYTELNSTAFNKEDNHIINLNIEYKIDSLSDLVFNQNFQYSKIKNTYNEDILYSDLREKQFRETITENSFNSNKKTSISSIEWEKKFKKKDRLFSMQYKLQYNEVERDGKLISTNNYFVSLPVLPDFRQKKDHLSYTLLHKINSSFTEPIGEKWSVNLNYEYEFSDGQSKWDTYNADSTNDFVLFDITFSNRFFPRYFMHQPSAGVSYKLKKISISSGTRFRDFNIQNFSFYDNTNIKYSVQNWLPYFNISIKPNKTTFFRMNYRTSSQVPDLNKLQPVRNNNNPNFIVIGNPELIPTIHHNFSMNAYTYKPISNSYFWFSTRYTYSEIDFANATHYDSAGRSISQTINVRDNYNFNFNVSGSFRLFKNTLFIGPFFEYNNSKRVNYINFLMNKTFNQTYYTGLNLGTDFNKEKWTWNTDINASVAYNIPVSTLNQMSNQPYYTFYFSFNTSFEWNSRFQISTDVNWRQYKNFSAGFNQNPIIWNASAGVKVDKKKRLKISLLAYDLLNQNISIQREVYSNVITDKKINIIRQYFLIQLTYQFNITGQVETDEDDE